MCDRHANCQPHRNSNGDGYAPTNANSQIGANGKAAPHASAQALEFRSQKFRVIGDRVGNRWFVVLGRRARSDAPYLHTRTRAELGRAGSPLHADFHRALPRPD